MKERDLALLEAYKGIKPRSHLMTIEAFFKAFSDWEVIPVTIRKRIVGAILVKNEEIHVSVNQESRGLWIRKSSFNILKRILKEYGTIKTKALKSCEPCHYFIERLGFKQTFEDNQFFYYEKTEVLNVK